MTSWINRQAFRPDITVAAFFAVIALFFYGSIVWTFVMSLTRSTLVPTYEIDGFDQYVKLFTNQRWLVSCLNMVIFGLLYIVGTLAFGMLLVEGAITDWSAIYLRDVFGAVPPVTGFAFTAFGFLMAAGRLAGDFLSMRFGPVAMARVCCAIGVAGILAMVLAPSPTLVIIGAAAAGFGVSIVFPLAVTAAASRDGSSAVNVAALSLLSFSGFLVGPPMIGFVTEFFGLRIGLATLLLAAGMSLALAGEVRVRRKGAALRAGETAHQPAAA